MLFLGGVWEYYIDHFTDLFVEWRNRDSNSSSFDHRIYQHPSG
jgi:hypothetical protein